MSENKQRPKQRTRGPWTPEERARREENKRLRAEGKLPPIKKVGHPPWTEEQKRAAAEKRSAFWKAKNEAEYERAKDKIEAMKAARLAEMKLEPLAEGEKKNNTRYLREARVGYNLPPINIDDPAQVEQRINDYLDFCEINDKRPTIVGIANWVGVNPQQISRWEYGKSKNGSTSRIIERFRAMMEEFMVDQLQDTKNNPASWIFLLKNMFGYKDQTDLVVGNQPNDGAEMSKEDIEKWFLEDGNTIDTTFRDQEGGHA